ncbi:hypothetical protein [Arthrobacter sp. R-11]|uniref:hypothetical protein n=1 Tax=Arthrobacter sp. R-11 TaxID=3404053 RepID=UPI003CF3B1A3
MWLTVAGACLTGLVLGDIAARYVPTRAGQILLIILASAGAAATIARRPRRDWLILAIPFNPKELPHVCNVASPASFQCRNGARHPQC